MLALNFLHGSEIPHCNAIVDKRFIGYCTLQFVYRGQISLAYNSKKYLLQAPAVWPCMPGPHIQFFSPQHDWHHFHIAVNGEQLDDWQQAGLWPEQVIEHIPNPEQLKQDWQQLLNYSQHNNSNSWDQQRAINILEKICLDLLPDDQANTREATWVSQAKQFLEQGLEQRAVAKKLGMGISTFRRRFTDACNMCPQDWLAQQRIDQARTLLTDSTRSIQDIAEDIGFYDAAHFARYFKQRVGLSPRAYRQMRY